MSMSGEYRKKKGEKIVRIGFKFLLLDVISKYILMSVLIRLI